MLLQYEVCSAKPTFEPCDDTFTIDPPTFLAFRMPRRHQKSARQQKQSAAGHRTERTLWWIASSPAQTDGSDSPRLRRGRRTQQSTGSDLEQILGGKGRFLVSSTGNHILRCNLRDHHYRTQVDGKDLVECLHRCIEKRLERCNPSVIDNQVDISHGRESCGSNGVTVDVQRATEGWVDVFRVCQDAACQVQRKPKPTQCGERQR